MAEELQQPPLGDAQAEGGDLDSSLTGGGTTSHLIGQMEAAACQQVPGSDDSGLVGAIAFRDVTAAVDEQPMELGILDVLAPGEIPSNAAGVAAGEMLGLPGSAADVPAPAAGMYKQEKSSHMPPDSCPRLHAMSSSSPPITGNLALAAAATPVLTCTAAQETPSHMTSSSAMNLIRLPPLQLSDIVASATANSGTPPLPSAGSTGMSSDMGHTLTTPGGSQDGSTELRHPSFKHWTFEEQFKQLYEISDDPDRRRFLDSLFEFMQKRGSPVSRIPIMAKMTLDFYKLFTEVVNRGGLIEVINKKQWRDVANALGIPSSITSAAFTLKTQYVKYLYPFECETKQLSTPDDLKVVLETANRRDIRQSTSTPQTPSTPYRMYGLEAGATSQEYACPAGEPCAKKPFMAQTSFCNMRIQQATTDSGGNIVESNDPREASSLIVSMEINGLLFQGVLFPRTNPAANPTGSSPGQALVQQAVASAALPGIAGGVAKVHDGISDAGAPSAPNVTGLDSVLHGGASDFASMVPSDAPLAGSADDALGQSAMNGPLGHQDMAHGP